MDDHGSSAWFNDRVMLNACLKYRYIIVMNPIISRAHLDDFPLTLEYGKKIDALRTAYKDFLWMGSSVISWKQQ